VIASFERYGEVGSRNGEEMACTLALSGEVESSRFPALVVEFVIRDALEGRDVIVHERVAIE